MRFTASLLLAIPLTACVIDHPFADRISHLFSAGGSIQYDSASGRSQHPGTSSTGALGLDSKMVSGSGSSDDWQKGTGGSLGALSNEVSFASAPGFAIFGAALILLWRIRCRDVRRAFEYRLGAAAAMLLTASMANADSFTNVAVTTSAFGGGIYNSYDSVNGTQQKLSSVPIYGAATNTTGPNDASISFDSVAPTPAADAFATSAYANLATGSLGVAATANFDEGLAEAMLQDSVTFDNTTGHVVDIDVNWTIDGSIVYTPVADTIESYFCFGAINCQVIGGIPAGGDTPAPDGTPQAFRYQDSTSGSAGVTVNAPTGGWVSTSYTATPVVGTQLSSGTTDINVEFQGVFAVPTGVSTDYVYGNLYTSCGGGSPAGACDFSHTATVSFDLNGLSFTSGSGDLLTEASTPEPAAWALLITLLGLTGVIEFCRRSRRGSSGKL